MSSSTTSSVGFDSKAGIRDKGRGIPQRCRCGQSSIVRTSTTMTNPGRLFHCCPFGSKQDTCHLFKWTDEAVVEDMEDVKILLDTCKKELGTLEELMVASESEISNRCAKNIEHLQTKLSLCEEEIQICHNELRAFKNITLKRIGSVLPVPFIVMNYDSLYSKLFEFIESCENLGTVSKGEVSALWKVCNNNFEALTYLAEFYELPYASTKPETELRKTLMDD